MKKNILFFTFILLTKFISAQSCVGCNTIVAGTDTSIYVVGNGEMLCVDLSGHFIGELTLSGGTVCIQGVFSPISINFSSGLLINSGSTNISSSISLGNTSQITNNAGGVINIQGNITLNTGSLYNNGIVNITNNISNSGSITNSSLINCIQLSGNGSINNTGSINSN